MNRRSKLQKYQNCLENKIFQSHENHHLSIEIFKEDQIIPAREVVETCFQSTYIRKEPQTQVNPKINKIFWQTNRRGSRLNHKFA